ncbi:hypothetical protein [Litorilituus sediminis]|uniref:Uncharacterized protein n=1 Tax=Litorilituus sediminis TaxID=718192 RepID=A0A4P6P0Z9_9GAMM|nr:hypothetical protein [Litorilituus sediminis]QBG34633.1 hypothetical protein EMK97_02195 [Litorilituus sediminis]
MKVTDQRVLKEAKFVFIIMFLGISIITAVGVSVKYAKFGVFKPEGLLLACAIFIPVLIIFSWVYAYFDVLKKN